MPSSNHAGRCSARKAEAMSSTSTARSNGSMRRSSERSRASHMRSFSRTWPNTRGTSAWDRYPLEYSKPRRYTPMILLTGRYSGLIQPDEHYVELRKDFSNVEDVLRQVEDIPALEAMADRAYQHLIASGAYSYRRFIELVDGVIERKLSEREKDVEWKAPTHRAGRRRILAAHEERPTVTELPTVYPLDPSHYFRRELDRLRASALADSTIGDLAGELARRSLARLLGWRRGWIAARLKRDPGVFAKARVAMRAIGAYPASNRVRETCD